MNLPELSNDEFTWEEFINSLEENESRQLYHLLKEREDKNFAAKLNPLPEFANNEFKVFDDRKDVKLSEKVMEIRKRRYVAFVYYYSNVDRTDDQMIDHIKLCNPQLSYSQALRDLDKIKSVIGNLPKVRKELVRHQVIEMHKMAFQRAEQRGEPKSMVAAANGITEAAGLKNDTADIPWEEMMSPSWEPTSNLEALGEGYEKRTNVEADIAKMKKKYGDIEDADIV